MFTRNRIELTGNIAKAAETTKAGDSTVTKVRLMHNEVIHRAEGDPIERLVAVDLEIWGKRGEAFAKHVDTKTPVAIEGRLQLDQWESNGEKRSRLLVRVDDWQFLAAKTGGDAAEGGEKPKGKATKKAA
jgi:single-strand DNA-binding protein